LQHKDRVVNGAPPFDRVVLREEVLRRRLRRGDSGGKGERLESFHVRRIIVSFPQ
jgi:hypothetical protein